MAFNFTFSIYLFFPLHSQPFVAIHLIYSFELNELVLNNAIIPPAEVLHIYQNHKGKNAHTLIFFCFTEWNVESSFEAWKWWELGEENVCTK